MKTENAALMKQARESLSGKWGLAIGTFVTYFVIIGLIQAIPVVGIVASFLITGPMTVGMAIFSLSLSRNRNPELNQIFEGFKRFGVSLGAYLLTILFTMLWGLLLIIPGIIAALSYSMTFYIIAESGPIGIKEAINKSKKMMYGYKWKYFCLFWRFFGWALLCILTLGIGFLWLFPYMQISTAKFYDDVKAQTASGI